MLTSTLTKACRVCEKEFAPRSSTAVVCSYRCAMKSIKAKNAAAEKAEADDRRETKAKLDSMKSLRKLRSEAQTAFNAFIRARDRLAGVGCICCGAPLDWNSTKPGGAVDAGHFVSRGSAIELAFDERNVNAQRKGCNRPGGTTRAKFTAGMTLRYGAEVVAELEGPHELPHLKAEDFRRIKTTYRAKARELTKETA